MKNFTKEEKLLLKPKLEIINFMSLARWAGYKSPNSSSNISNYFESNYHPVIKGDGEQKLLSHLLTYISDRQTPFMRCFNIGVYVYSYLVHEFYEVPKKTIIEILNKAFITIGEHCYLSAPFENSQTDTPQPKGPVISCNRQCRTFFVEQGALAYWDKNSKQWQIVQEDSPQGTDYAERVIFASRFLPADIVCIYKTLTQLQTEYEGSFKNFLQMNIIDDSNDENNDDNGNTCVTFLAKAMYELTYEQVGQPSYRDICTSTNNSIQLDEKKLNKFARVNLKTIKLNKKRKEQIGPKKNYTHAVCEQLQNLDTRCEWDKVKYTSKRLWCCLRDFIKASQFQTYFEALIGSATYTKLKRASTSLELPGDVWNSNSEFKQCFFNEVDIQDLAGLNVSEFIRKIHEKYEPTQPFTPEDFDITFDFVPRMCKKQNCVFCPVNFSNQSHEKNKVQELCHHTQNMTCPILLLTCGYRYECPGKNKCKIHEYHCKK
jgi:hypothetical protein